MSNVNINKSFNFQVSKYKKYINGWSSDFFIVIDQLLSKQWRVTEDWVTTNVSQGHLSQACKFLDRNWNRIILSHHYHQCPWLPPIRPWAARVRPPAWWFHACSRWSAAAWWGFFPRDPGLEWAILAASGSLPVSFWRPGHVTGHPGRKWQGWKGLNKGKFTVDSGPVKLTIGSEYIEIVRNSSISIQNRSRTVREPFENRSVSWRLTLKCPGPWF